MSSSEIIIFKVTPPAVPNPLPARLFIPTLSEVTNTSKIGKTVKLAPNVIVCPKQDPVSKTNKKPSQFKTKDLVAPTLHN